MISHLFSSLYVSPLQVSSLLFSPLLSSYVHISTLLSTSLLFSHPPVIQTPTTASYFCKTPRNLSSHRPQNHTGAWPGLPRPGVNARTLTYGEKESERERERVYLHCTKNMTMAGCTRTILSEPRMATYTRMCDVFSTA